MAGNSDLLPQRIERLRVLVDRYRGKKGTLIPALQDIQEEFGYIPPEAIEILSDALKIFPVDIQGVITFYAQFSMKPKGRNVVQVCRGTACHVRGGRGVLRTVKKYLNISEGETSKDYKWTLETVACLGACALSPVMVINKTYYGKMTPKRIEILLGQSH